jgi:hypothetical protein
MSNYPALPRAKPAHFSLINSHEAMVSRLKAARVRRNEADWWREQLAESKGLPFSTRLFVIMAVFNLASEPTLLANAGAIAEGLDGLNPEEWSTTVQLLSSQIDRNSFSRRPEQSSATAPRFTSYRLSYLFALRSSRVLARKLFLQNLLDQPDGNLPIAELRQVCALDAALVRELDWAPAMKIIQETYALGAAYRLRRFIVPGRMLPEHIADEILLNPTQYPTTLWDIAESVASAKARKAVRAVGPIARTEKWFPN